MKNTRRTSGFTLVEMMMAIVMMAIVISALVKLYVPIQQYFWRSTSSQKTTMQARVAMDTMSRALREGMASSVSICDCVDPDPMNYKSCAPGSGCTSATATSNSPPNSQIEFKLQGNTTDYVFYWAESAIQMHTTFHIQGHPPIEHQVTLATSIPNINFTQSAADPAIIYVTLTSSSPAFGFSSQNPTAGLTFDKEEVHMLAAN